MSLATLCVWIADYASESLGIMNIDRITMGRTAPTTAAGTSRRGMLNLLLMVCLTCGSLTGPLVSGLLSVESQTQREDRETGEEEAIRGPAATQVRRLSEVGCRREHAVSQLTTVDHMRRKSAGVCAGRFTFRGSGHRLELATTAPLLC